MISLDTVLAATGGRASPACPRAFRGVSTDSRTVRAGDLFFAVRAQRDGHDFVAAALGAGAGAAVVEDSSGLFEMRRTDALISVPSTVAALGDLARLWRKSIAGMKVVCITGSTGKTTTRRALEAVVASSGREFVAGKKSFNNHLGLPLTLLEAGGGCGVCLAEAGVNSPGEMARLAEIASPDMGAVTNIGTAHIGNFGSREKIAGEKARLFEGFGKESRFAVNLDDPLAEGIAAGLSCRKTSFSMRSRSADVSASGVTHSTGRMDFSLLLGGRAFPVSVRAAGEHNVMNLLCAAALGMCLDIPPGVIAEGVRRFEPAGMRMEVLGGRGGLTLINDCYNASPDSVSAALRELCRLKQAAPAGTGAVAVLGDMLELGDRSAEYHREAGREAARLGVDFLVGFGGMADEVRAGAPDVSSHSAVSHGDAADIIASVAKPGDIVLIKGSRAMEMERITSLLRPQGGGS
ncbi:MAG: UDP-N-acetylmuramoyl-tripeptide--D-alanyl-D-alanine ligase [Candidatus Dadabacteria bacterium]|nr:UDP-N-acetylmuramoyl-tripeptide--D-alanyl-D-alanine ligase [Candidatus Dadabacteria bacterium]